MLDFLSKLFDVRDFPARWHCGNWSSFHGWLHICSDLAIFGAYLAIPLVLAYFAKRQANIRFPRVLWLFSAFILACGITHLNEVIIFWFPLYRFAGVMKLITAVVSWATVFSLIAVLPRALALQSPATLEAEVSHRTAELRAAEDQIALMVEAAPNAMLMVDGDRRIFFLNSATEHLFGYRRDELLGQQVELLVPDAMRAAHPANVERFLQAPLARPMGANRDLHGLHKDGTEVPVEIGLTPVETPDGMRVLASIIDITERKQAEAERERLITDLQRSNDDLAQFAYVASHDLQEPLRTVVSYTELLASRYQDQLDEKADKFIAYVVEGGTRMQQLLDDLLAYSRVGTHGSPMAPVDANTALEDALSNLTIALRESGGTCETGHLPHIYADAVQLTQLFQNLIGNALKFRRADVTPVVHIDARSDGADWVFEVQDNGIGIAPEFHDRVLRPFQRLHQRDRYPGSGIGLAIAKKIVERHGGRLWIESTVGEGTSFFFTMSAPGEETTDADPI